MGEKKMVKEESLQNNNRAALRETKDVKDGEVNHMASSSVTALMRQQHTRKRRRP